MKQLSLPFEPPINDLEQSLLLFMRDVAPTTPSPHYEHVLERLVDLGLASVQLIPRKGAQFARPIREYRVTDTGAAWANKSSKLAA
jgi:hypothetical protein